MWKFKWLKGKDKWLFLLTLGVIFCILAFPAERFGGNVSGNRNGDAAAGGQLDNAAKEAVLPASEADGGGVISSLPASAAAAKTYEEELEQRVRDILKNVEGVGKVDVMIVLKASGEKVIHVDETSSQSVTEEKDSSGGSRKIESREQGASTILTGSGGNGAPIIEKELRPELSGIIISASGGGNPTVKAEISAAMEALFGLPAHKIKVLKRVE